MSVLFFWAGKTSSRELEEFINDLVGETKNESTLLALSLLVDQGERLDHDTRRNLATYLITKPVGDTQFSHDIQQCLMQTVPEFVYNQFASRILKLRGLSTMDSCMGLVRLLSDQVLLPGDLHRAKGEMPVNLAAALLMALNLDSVKMSAGLREAVGPVTARDWALHCLYYTFYVSLGREGRELQKCRGILGEWLREFPEGKEWIALLLTGAIYENNSDRNKLIIPLLWEWRNQPVDESWLQASDNCMGHLSFL